MNQKPDLRCVGGTEVPDASLGSRTSAVLPAPLRKARRGGLEALQALLGRVFEKADDTFFECANKAESNQIQEAYLETMRQFRLHRKGIERSFFQNINKGFLGLAESQATLVNPADVPTVVSDNSNELSLLGNDELEMGVAIDGMVSKAKNTFSDRLYHLTMRLDALMYHLTVSDNLNPFHPKRVCEAFKSAADVVDCEINNRLIVFKLFDQFVIQQYDEVLDAVNVILAEAGILPDLKGAPVTTRAVRDQRSSAQRDSSSKGNSENSISENSTTGQNAQQVERPVLTGSNELFGQLKALIASVRHVPMITDEVGGTIGSPDLNAREVPNGELIELLSRLQKIQPGGRDAVNGELGLPKFNVRSAVAQYLTQAEASEGPSRVGESDADVMSLISMLFDFILDDDQLPVSVKALLGRLQIPFLKLAIQDYGFFNRGGHPARKLLNELARAGIGLAGNTDQLKKDMVFKKIQETVQRILNEFECEASLFDELLHEFNQFMQTEVRRSQLIEQRTKATEEGKAKAESAEKVAMETIRKRLDVDGRVIPDVVNRLLMDGWLSVLKLVYLKYGPESNNWVGAVKTIDHLILSVTPPRDDSIRKKLFNIVPILLKNIRQGLNSVSFNPFDMGQLFSELEQVQMQVLRGETPEHLEYKVSDPAKDLVAAVTEDMERMGASPVIPQKAKVTPLDVTKTARTQETNLSPLSPDDVHLIKAKQVNVGTWMEFCNEQGVTTRCKLAAHIKSADKMIFVNRTGVKIDEKSTLGLAHALKNGEVTILENSLLFDRALQNVIGNLRKAKETSI